MSTVPPIEVQLVGDVSVPAGVLQVKSASEEWDVFRASEMTDALEQAAQQRWLQYEEELAEADTLDVMAARAELAWRERKWRETS